MVGWCALRGPKLSATCTMLGHCCRVQGLTDLWMARPNSAHWRYRLPMLKWASKCCGAHLMACLKHFLAFSMSPCTGTRRCTEPICCNKMMMHAHTAMCGQGRFLLVRATNLSAIGASQVTVSIGIVRLQSAPQQQRVQVRWLPATSRQRICARPAALCSLERFFKRRLGAFKVSQGIQCAAHEFVSAEVVGVERHRLPAEGPSHHGSRKGSAKNTSHSLATSSLCPALTCSGRRRS